MIAEVAPKKYFQHACNLKFSLQQKVGQNCSSLDMTSHTIAGLTE